MQAQLQVNIFSCGQLKPSREVPMSEALNLPMGAAHQAAKAFKPCSGLLGMRPERRSSRARRPTSWSAHV